MGTYTYIYNMDDDGIRERLHQFINTAGRLQLDTMFAATYSTVHIHQMSNSLARSGCLQTYRHPVSKKRKHLYTKEQPNDIPRRGRESHLSLTWLSVHVFDIVACVVFSFLGISEHFRLARTCRALLLTSGIRPPVLCKSRGWNKMVTMPRDITNDQLRHLCSFASIRQLDLLTVKPRI
jgi:hypothetical protein